MSTKSETNLFLREIDLNSVDRNWLNDFIKKESANRDIRDISGYIIKNRLKK